LNKGHRDAPSALGPIEVEARKRRKVALPLPAYLNYEINFLSVISLYYSNLKWRRKVKTKSFFA
jgi:hypothetical protein